jgi:hypothetical protein
MKHLKAIVRIFFAVTVVVLVILAIVKMRSQKCERIVLRFDNNVEIDLVQKEEIMSLLQKDSIETIGKTRHEVEALSEKIIKSVHQHPYVIRCNRIYLTGNTLVLLIQAAIPFIKVHTANGDYVIDKQAYLIPNSPKIKDIAWSVSGQTTEPYILKQKIDTMSSLNSIFLLARNLENYPALKKQFNHIHINQNKDMEIFPTEGNCYILFGKIQDLEQKCENLENIYGKLSSQLDMNQYALLDSRFSNRIIAKKR